MCELNAIKLRNHLEDLRKHKPEIMKNLGGFEDKEQLNEILEKEMNNIAKAIMMKEGNDLIQELKGEIQ